MIALKHEPDVPFVQLRAVLFVHTMNRMLEEVILACPCAVMHSEQMQQSRLPRSGRPHDGDKLSLFDVDINAPQNVRAAGAVFEVLLYIPQRDHQSRMNLTGGSGNGGG